MNRAEPLCLPSFELVKFVLVISWRCFIYETLEEMFGVWRTSCQGLRGLPSVVGRQRNAGVRKCLQGWGLNQHQHQSKTVMKVATHQTHMHTNTHTHTHSHTHTHTHIFSPATLHKYRSINMWTEFLTCRNPSTQADKTAITDQITAAQRLRKLPQAFLSDLSGGGVGWGGVEALYNVNHCSNNEPTGTHLYRFINQGLLHL